MQAREEAEEEYPRSLPASVRTEATQVRRDDNLEEEETARRERGIAEWSHDRRVGERGVDKGR